MNTPSLSLSLSLSPSLPSLLAYLHSLHSETEDVVLGQLLSHLLLLHPGNEKAREEFLRLLPKVLLSSSEEPDYLDHCQQLLSLALVHPAFPQEDRETLTYWRSRLDEKCRIVHGRISKTGSPASSSSLPRPSIPRRIYQTGDSHSDDIGGHSGRNGSSRIYINGVVPGQVLGSNTLPLTNGFESAHNGGGVGGESDMALLDEEEEVALKTFPLQPGQSLPRPHHHHPTMDNHQTHGSCDDFFRRGYTSKSNSLPVPRTASVCSLPAMLDDQSTISWKTGMKGVCVCVCVCVCMDLV